LATPQNGQRCGAILLELNPEFSKMAIDGKLMNFLAERMPVLKEKWEVYVYGR
jgi:hypothetical protein